MGKNKLDGVLVYCDESLRRQIRIGIFTFYGAFARPLSRISDAVNAVGRSRIIPSASSRFSAELRRSLDYAGDESHHEAVSPDHHLWAFSQLNAPTTKQTMRFDQRTMRFDQRAASTVSSMALTRAASAAASTC